MPNNKQFLNDYAHGKTSEEISLPDLDKIFNTTLRPDEDGFASFDFFNDEYCVELKTRDDMKFKDGEFHYTTKKGKKMIVDTLFFDSPKIQKAWQNINKRNCKKKYFIVWKCSGEYFYWQMNWEGEGDNRRDFYVEGQSTDFGHGFRQERSVINVYAKAITQAIMT
tara:strand:+ start:79 stop:576 length:498 start_codon:yes stop_codon:yes gene_type:complete